MHSEVGDGNEGFTAMNVDLKIAIPSTKDVTASRLGMELHLSRMEMAWISQDQGMTEREDGFVYDREGIRHHCVGTHGQYMFE